MQSKIGIAVVCALLFAVGITYQNCGQMADPSSEGTKIKEFQTNMYRDGDELPAPPKDAKAIPFKETILPPIFESMNVAACRGKECSPISVTVKGLEGPLMLKTNIQGEEMAIKGDGIYKFKNLVAAKKPVIVDVIAQPEDQVCEVTRSEGVTKSGFSTSATFNIFNAFCYKIPKSCMKGEKNWHWPTSQDQFVTTDVSLSGQHALAMSENLQSVIATNHSEIVDGWEQFSQHTYVTDITSNVTVETQHNIGGYGLIHYDVDQNASGNILAAGDSNGHQIKVYQYDTGIWQSPVSISGIHNSILELETGIANNNDAIVVWDGSAMGGPYQFHCFMAHRQNGNNWTFPTNINDHLDLHPTEHCRYVSVAMARNTSKAMVTWQQDDKIYLSEFDGTTWHHPASVDDYFVVGEKPKISYSDNGQRFVIAYQKSDRQFYVATKELGVWSPSVNVFGPGGMDGDPPWGKVVINNSGNILLLGITDFYSPFSYHQRLRERKNGSWGDSILLNGYNHVWNDMDLNNFGRAIITANNFKLERWNGNVAWNALDFIGTFVDTDMSFYSSPGGFFAAYQNDPPHYGDGHRYFWKKVKIDQQCNAVLSFSFLNNIYKGEYK